MSERPGPSLERVRGLFDETAGDEKHDPSAQSVLVPLWVLYDRVLHHDPADPGWAERDRFLLSKGHGPLALYAILAAWGYFPEAELGTFLQRGSRLGGHPDRNLVPGIEISTGSLGHGVPMAMGVALALRARGATNHTYVLLGDGEANEGSVWESAVAAGSLGLSNLTAILIDNHTSTPALGDLGAKLAAFGWASTTVPANDVEAIATGLRSRVAGRPTVVVADWRGPGG